MGSNHDRNLITSYYLFDCGYGFVLSDTERLVGTKLTIFPITHTSTLPIIQKLKSIKSHWFSNKDAKFLAAINSIK